MLQTFTHSLILLLTYSHLAYSVRTIAWPRILTTNSPYSRHAPTPHIYSLTKIHSKHSFNQNIHSFTHTERWGAGVEYHFQEI